MIKMVEVKFRISEQQRDLFSQRCNDMNISRSARLGEIVDADLENRIVSVAKKPVPSKPNPHLTKLEEDLGRGFSRCIDRINHIAESVRYIPTSDSLEKQFEKLAHGNTKISGVQSQILSSNQTIASKLDRLSERSRSEDTLPIYKRFDCHVGLLGGFIGFIAFLMFIPGDWAPARSIAKLTLGERSNVAAAAKLIDDPILRYTIAVSTPLARSREYREDLTACKDKARQAKEPSLCTMRIPALAQSE